MSYVDSFKFSMSLLLLFSVKDLYINYLQWCRKEPLSNMKSACFYHECRAQSQQKEPAFGIKLTWREIYLPRLWDYLAYRSTAICEKRTLMFVISCHCWSKIVNGRCRKHYFCSAFRKKESELQKYPEGRKLINSLIAKTYDYFQSRI